MVMGIADGVPNAVRAKEFHQASVCRRIGDCCILPSTTIRIAGPKTAAIFEIEFEDPL